jgi:putative membrane protein
MEISPLLFSWVKAVHIIAIISWMAGLLYLPRLFIYHCMAETGSDKSETFKVMERRLLRLIMNPAMIVSLISGGLMIYSADLFIFTELWFVIKAVSLCFLVAIHMKMGKWRKDFEMDNNQRKQTFFRVANEVPTILMIIIIIMVVVRPI